jgi:hypothetical protein
MSSITAVPKYNEDLHADIETSANDSPKVKVHRVEWAKVRWTQQALLLLQQRTWQRCC